MLGGARKGYCSIESPRITTTPIKSVRIEITIATIGRRIKKLAMDHQLPYISTSVPALLERFASKYESHLDRVSTGSGSDLVKPRESKIVRKYRMLITDQVATAPCTDPIQVRALTLAGPPRGSEELPTSR